MTDNTRPWQVTPKNAIDGDCQADPVPALWNQDDEDMYIESGFVEKFWLPVAIAVLAGWASVSFVLVNAFGWMVILAVAAVVLAGSAAAVALVKMGERRDDELAVVSFAEPEIEQEDTHFQQAA